MIFSLARVHGFVRANFRDGAEHPRVPLELRAVARLAVDSRRPPKMGATGNRIRLLVSFAAFLKLTAVPIQAPASVATR